MFFKGVLGCLTLGDEGSEILQNTGSNIPNGTVSHPRIRESLAAGLKTPDFAGHIIVDRFLHLFWSQ
jgi:hypothetical protein